MRKEVEHQKHLLKLLLFLLERDGSHRNIIGIIKGK